MFSPQTDVYSLGATLYFLLTGNTPPTSAQLLEEGLKFPTNISEATQYTIKKAMSASRTNRPQSICDFLNNIQTLRTPTTTHPSTNNISLSEDTIFTNFQPESPTPNPAPPQPRPNPVPNPEPKNSSTGKNIIGISIIIVAFIVVLIMFNTGKCSTQNNSTINAISDSDSIADDIEIIEELVVNPTNFSESIKSEPVISSDAQTLKNSRLIDFYGYGYQIKYPSCLDPKESTGPDQKIFSSDFLAIDIRRFENSDYEAYQEWIGYAVGEYLTSNLIYEHESGTSYYFSGYNGSVIVYGKIVLKNSVLYSAIIYYNQDVKKEMDNLIPKMLRNFPN